MKIVCNIHDFFLLRAHACATDATTPGNDAREKLHVLQHIDCCAVVAVNRCSSGFAVKLNFCECARIDADGCGNNTICWLHDSHACLSFSFSLLRRPATE